MLRLTFNLDDPEGTHKVERIGDEAEPLDILCEILLRDFERWVAEEGITP